MAVYQELLKSSARRYCSVQLLPKKGDSYFAPGRDANLPLLVAWNEEDRRRLPTLTAALIEEVKAQTRVAAKAPAPKLSAKAERDYAGLDRCFPAATFEARRDYLKTNTEMDFGYFHHLFGVKSEYTRDEAARLQPLLAEYRSNISKTFVTEDDRIRYTRSLETAIYVLWRNLGSAPVQPSLAPAPVCTNCIQVSRFLEVPQQLFMEGKRREQLNASTILGHGYSGERLWLDVRYGRSYAYSFNGGAGWVDTNGAAVAILDPDAGSWELIRYPESNAKPFSESTSFPNLLSPVPGFEDFEHNRGEFCVPFEGALFLSEWNSLIRYSLESRRWVTLPVPWQIPTELFVVKDQLLAANREGIYQLVNGGERINVLASARRSPAVSILDSMDSFGRVRLFPGPGNTVRALLPRGVYSWDGREWTKLFSASKVWRSEIREGGAFFMIQLFDEIPGLWFLPDDRNELELCLTTPPGTLSAYYVQPTPPAKTNAIPTWRSPWGGKLTEAAVGTFGSNVLLFVEQSPVNDYLGNNGANDGRTGNLIYLERGRTNGFLVPLKFDSNQGPFHRHLPDYQMGTRFPYDLTWLVVTPKFVFIGQDKLRGVWTFPTAELDAAIAREKAKVALSASNHEPPVK